MALLPPCAGLAAMIDTVRAVTRSSCSLQYTVFFVAFDKEEVSKRRRR